MLVCVLPRALSSVLSGSCVSVREHACVFLAHASVCPRAKSQAAYKCVSFLEHSCLRHFIVHRPTCQAACMCVSWVCVKIRVQCTIRLNRSGYGGVGLVTAAGTGAPQALSTADYRTCSNLTLKHRRPCATAAVEHRRLRLSTAG